MIAAKTNLVAGQHVQQMRQSRRGAMDRRARMAVKDRAGERRGEHRRQAALLGELAEERAVGEAAHAHHRFDPRASSIQRQRAVRLARHPGQAEIKIRRVGLVQRQLPPAGRLAPRERGEVHIVKSDRFFDLEGAVAG